MPDELVLDASVAIKIFLNEDGSTEARALVASGVRFIAPALVLAEIANVLLKRVRRGEVTSTFAMAVLQRARPLFEELAPIESLAERGFAIAAGHQISAYDGLYVALAEDRRWPLATADLRLARGIAQSRLAIATWTP